MSKTIIVPVSGGKDSQVVLALALKEDREIVCVHQNTGYDHPLTYKQIDEMEKFYGVTIEHTVNKWGGMFGWLEQAKYFPNSGARGCTQRLKQEPFAKWLIDNNYNESNCEIWFGMRSDESRARNDKYGGITMDDDFTLGDISDFYNKGKIGHLGKISAKLPIVEWTTDEIFFYLAITNAPVNELYSKGHLRVGCYPCFLARKQEWVNAGKDDFGRENLNKLLELEKKWETTSTNKFIKVHRVWDVRDFLKDGDNCRELTNEECGWCSI